MVLDVPVFQKCCFYLPLKPGLVFWGCFKLLVASVMLSYYLTKLQNVMDHYVECKNDIWTKELWILSVIVFGVCLDIVFQTILIVGAQKGYINFLKSYFIYTIVMLILLILLIIPIENSLIKNMVGQYTEYLGRTFSINLSFIFIGLFYQTYLLLLVRSEIFKLKSNTQFARFENSAAEDDYSMRIRDPYEVEEHVYPRAKILESIDYNLINSV